MIHAIQISKYDRHVFSQFVENGRLAASGDFKFMPGCDYILVLFRDRLECEYIEMSWNMLKDEIKRDQRLASAA